jgi:Recombinase/Recombinase zinc beta ribbon domain
MRQGRIPGMGGARYGYRLIDGQLVLHEPEARIVRQIFQLYNVGDESGQRLQTPTIANRLNAQQVPPPVTNNNRRMKRAPQWSAPTLLRILADEIYAGRCVYGARTSYRRRTKSAAAPIELSVPAIVDQNLWLATVARRESNRINAARNTKRFYLMRGLLRCSCGRAMIGHHDVRSSITRYECSGYHNGFKCGQRHVRAEIVHREIWTNVWQLLNVQDFAGFIRAQAVMEQQRHSDKAARLAEIERTIGERKAETERLALAIAKGHAGALGDALERTAHEIDDHLAALRAEQREIRTALGIVQISDAQLAGVSEFRAAVLAGHAHATDREKRAVLEALNVRAIIKEHQLRLSYHFGAPMESDSNAYSWEYTSQLSLIHTLDLADANRDADGRRR